MKKFAAAWAIAVWAVLGAVLGAMGCATSPAPPAAVSSAALSSADAAKVQQSLTEDGYDVDVEVKDVDHNGRLDFEVAYYSEPEDVDVMLASLAGYVGGMVYNQ